MSCWNKIVNFFKRPCILNRDIKKMEEIGFIIDAKTDNVRKELADTREKLFLTVNSYHNNTAREMNQAKESFDNIIRGMNNKISVIQDERSEYRKAFETILQKLELNVPEPILHYQKGFEDSIVSQISDLDERLKKFEPTDERFGIHYFMRAQYERMRRMDDTVQRLEQRIKARETVPEIVKRKPGRPKNVKI